MSLQLDESDLAGLQDLELLDLSNNYLTEVPTDALRRLTELKTLVLHSNLIQVSAACHHPRDTVTVSVRVIRSCLPVTTDVFLPVRLRHNGLTKLITHGGK